LIYAKSGLLGRGAPDSTLSLLSESTKKEKP
jgi:hypothetical protein